MVLLRSNKSSQSTRKPSVVTKIVSVSDFILDESGKAVGVKGLSFPDKADVTVTLTREGTKAENTKRKDFEAYRKGFMAFGRKITLEPGAVLRLNCTAKGENAFETDWINPMSGNKEAAKQSLRFGYTGVELYTPDAIKERYRAVEARVQSENPEASRYDVSTALLADLAETKDQIRYRGNVLQYHPDRIMDTEHGTLPEVLANYYGDKKFEKVSNEAGDKLYEPVSPGMVVRALNADGEVVQAMDVSGAMLYHAKAETPDERANYVVSLVEQSFPAEELASYSLLPYDRIRISERSMTVEPKTIPGIKSFERAQQTSYRKVTNEAGESGYENFAVQAAVKRADNGMITEIAIPHGAKTVDVALLAKDGSELREAGRQEEEESTGPGM